VIPIGSRMASWHQLQQQRRGGRGRASEKSADVETKETTDEVKKEEVKSPSDAAVVVEAKE